MIYGDQHREPMRSVQKFQVVHFRLAELQIKVELLRSLVYRAVED
jgi:alkylation response protein AidB-like acyl-CoA dehydrogenase